jgi:hypothetical protein
MEDKTEGWLIYSKKDEQLCVDVVVIVFSENKNLLYLFSDSTSRLDDVAYLTTVCNLVHDLPTDFELIKKITDRKPTEIPMKILIEKKDEPSNQ